MTRVIALRNGVSVGNSIVKENLNKTQKTLLLVYGGRVDAYGNVVATSTSGVKWEFQLKSIN
jgi:hypothetical protein